MSIRQQVTSRPVFATSTVLLALVWLAAGSAHAVTATDTHSVGGTYPTAGGTVDITVVISTSGSGSVLSLGITEAIPTGWTFNSVVSGPVPVIVPSAGASGPLNFGWGAVPPFPVTFVYRLDVPAGAGVAKTVSGTVVYVDDLGQNQQSSATSVTIQPDVASMPMHYWPALLALVITGAFVTKRTLMRRNAA